MAIVDETVIVADNDSMMRGLIRTMLDQPRRTLLLCADGTEAVDMAAHTLANLVLLDQRMPKMEGSEACRHIRELPRYARVPIVVMSVFVDDHFQRAALREGATAFLPKPFSRDQLLRAIDPLIRRPVTNAAARPP